MESFATKQVSGWGRYPWKTCHVYRPEKRRSVPEILGSHRQPHFIARGLGRSYGDTAVNEDSGVIDMTRLNRMLAFDPATGLLECEAGVSLAEILEAFVPRGFFLPVTPGTKFVTVGGAIANDVHGKNHHVDGTFGQFVRSFTLLTPEGSPFTCSPDEHADVFWATIGGIGLTGVILTAKILLRRIETAYFFVDYTQSRHIHETLERFAETDQRYQYSVAWVDCLAKGESLGRSVLMQGNHAPGNELPISIREPLKISRKMDKNVPFDLPAFALNPWSIKAFNAMFYNRHRTVEGKLVDYDTYFYPLDFVHNWNRLYGRPGFIQYQATLPKDKSAGLVELLERLSASNRASFLAVLKSMGPANPGLLSHPMEGYTLTLDIPVRHGLAAFIQELDDLVLCNEGRLYLAKDAMASPGAIAAMYPRLGEFKTIQHRLDPHGALSSSMARRLGIVD